MPKQPGDIIIDRALPGIGSEKRERARAKLREYAHWMLTIAMREVRAEMHGYDSRESAQGDRIESAAMPDP